MTRETKIGLLVGLAFIVVFAMLLSHSGPPTPPGTPIQVATAKKDAQSKPITLLPTPAEPAPQPVVPPIDETPVRDTASPLPLDLDPPQPVESIAHELPRPGLLEPTLSPPEAPGGVAEVDLPPPPAQPEPMENAVARAAPLVSRIAPPMVDEPRPVIRENLPTETPAPVAQSTPIAPPVDVDPAPVSRPPAVARGGEEYIVAKGDTLIGILQKKYGRASEQVMAAFKAANADVKDRHLIREGQKLILPDLGPDFEPVAARSIDLSKPTARTASSDLEKMLDNKTTRKAPEPRQTDSKKSDLANMLKKPEQKAEPEYRIYEVRPRDNFSTIAREQLGSETLWREIAKLNKNIDPARMLPGTKIKLPAKRPLADTVAESARQRG